MRCCARIHPDAATAARIRVLVGEDLDWERLLDAAPLHGIEPLLYWSLNTTCPEAVPKAVLRRLRRHFYANAGRTLFLTGELLKLLQALQAHGIPAIPFKGPTLAAAAYGNLALRQAGDLDILIHQRDLTRAEDLFTGNGYRRRAAPAGLRKAILQKAVLWEADFVHDAGSAIDLHWGLLPKYFAFPVSLERCWARCQAVTLSGAIVATLAPEDLLLFLCLHGAKHHWERLQWVCDIAGLVRAYPGLAWDRLMDEAAAIGARRMLLLGLFLAADLLGACLPEMVRRSIAHDRTIPVLSAQVQERLFSGFYLRALDSVQHRLRFCLLWGVSTILERAALAGWKPAP